MSKTVFITGANSGIGKELTCIYAKSGAKLLLTVRSSEAQKFLIKELTKKKVLSRCTVYLMDLESFDSVLQCIEALNTDGHLIDTVILNAGIHIPYSSKHSKDGFEKHYQVNYLANVLLATKLYEKEMLTANATVCYIASNAHKVVEQPLAKFNTYIYNYAYSKYCGIIYFLNFQTLHPQLRIKIIHPGLVNTNINKYKSGVIMKLFKSIRTYLAPQAAAQNIVSILESNNPHIYWEYSKATQPARSCMNYTIASKVWDKTTQQLKPYLSSQNRPKLVPNSNFAHTFTGLSAEVQFPSSAAAISKLIQEAKAKKKTIRTVGARHSYNDGFDSKSISISLRNLAKVKKIDKKNLTVTCQGGVSVNKLVTELHKKGVTLPFSGDYGEQTIAGAVSTGTHGYARSGGCLSELIVELTLIDGNGEIQRITEEGDLKIARLSLGMFGIIYEVVLKVIPINRYCEYSLHTMPRELVFSNLYEDCRDTDHIRFLANPFDPEYFICMKIKEYQLSKIKEKNIHKRVHFVVPEKRHDESESLIFLCVRSLVRHNTLVKSVLHQLSKRIHKTYYFMFDTGVFINDGIGNNRFPFFKIIYKALKKNKEYDMEIAVPIENFEKFYAYFVSVVKKYQHKDKSFEAFLSCRFLGKSDKVLLAANYHGSVIYNDIFVYKNNPLALEFLNEIEVNSIVLFAGKMHWGKFQTTAYPFILQNYPKSELKLFLKYKKKYDPNTIFSNYYTHRLFGTSY